MQNVRLTDWEMSDVHEAHRGVSAALTTLADFNRDLAGIKEPDYRVERMISLARKQVMYEIEGALDEAQRVLAYVKKGQVPPPESDE